jgi:hypothetical protein
MGPKLAAAFAEVAELDIPLAEVPDELGIPRAPCQHDLAVEMEHARRAGPFVQVIDVLGDDPDVVGPREVHQGPVGGIGLGRPESTTTRLMGSRTGQRLQAPSRIIPDIVH